MILLGSFPEGSEVRGMKGKEARVCLTLPPRGEGKSSEDRCELGISDTVPLTFQMGTQAQGEGDRTEETPQ